MRIEFLCTVGHQVQSSKPFLQCFSTGVLPRYNFLYRWISDSKQ